MIRSPASQAGLLITPPLRFFRKPFRLLQARSVILPLLPRLPHLRGLLPALQASCRFP